MSFMIYRAHMGCSRSDGLWREEFEHWLNALGQFVRDPSPATESVNSTIPLHPRHAHVFSLENSMRLA